MKYKATLLLAHGAGAPMDSAFMNGVSEGLASQGIRTVRFEFPYMQLIRQLGKRRPPDPAHKLVEVWRNIIHEYAGDQPLFIGGKSMGGRMASVVASEAEAVQGLICLGFPFHPPGKPDKLRTEPLFKTSLPTLIVQGERDPFGRRDEVDSYGLPSHIRVHWINYGNHDLAVPKRFASDGQSAMGEVANAVARFIDAQIETV